MQLNSADGASVELRIAGYWYQGHCQAPPLEAVQRLMGGADIPVVAGDWDVNWLQVRGNITPADGAAWAFEDPCLTTWEARELGDWLRAVAAGTVPPSPRGSDPGGGIGFTEPNLSFDLADRTADRVRIRTYFTAEAKPPWFQRGQECYPNSCLVVVDVSADEVAQAAESWMRDLAEFPVRLLP
jgi:hypothetical protein